MESRINRRVCLASILTLSLIRLDRGTALWRTPTVAANDTPLLTFAINVTELLYLVTKMPLVSGIPQFPKIYKFQYHH